MQDSIMNRYSFLSVVLSWCLTLYILSIYSYPYVTIVFCVGENQAL